MVGWGVVGGCPLPRLETPTPTPHPFNRLGQTFFRTFGQSTIFSGAFGAN